MAGYLGSRPVVVQVDGYQRTEAESRYVNVSGDDFTGHLDFTDDAKARFGSSDEMHIYTESSGSGYSYIQGDSIVLRKANQSTNYLTAIGGVVSLMHNGTTKLATASGGIDVTGTLTAKVAQTANTVMPVAKITTSGTYNSSGSSNAGGALSFGQYDDSYPAWNLGQIAGIRNGSGWNGDLLFYVNNGTSQTSISERARLDSAGNVLVGKTALNDAVVGVELRASGIVVGSAASNVGAVFNRNTSDGAIVSLKKGGAEVGTIGANGTYPYIGSHGTSGKGIKITDALLPATNAGAFNDADVNLGASNVRWKDLHLSGTVYVGAGMQVAGHPVVGYDSFDGGYAARLGSTGSSTLNATQIYAGGSVQATFKGGKVAIGTTLAPFTQLDVVSSGNSEMLIHADTDTVGSLASLMFKTDSQNLDSRMKGAIIFKRDDPGTRGTGSLHFCVNGVNSDVSAGIADSKLNISAAGNVGIGISAPQAELHVHDPAGHAKIRLSGTASNADTFEIYQGITGVTNGGLTIRDVEASADRLVIDSSGRVGIGTSSPDNPLEVVGADSGIKISSGSSNRPMLRLECGSDEKLILSSNTTYGAIGDGSDANRYMILKDGNVGIKNTDPQRLLHVSMGGSNIAGNGYDCAIFQNNDAVAIRLVDAGDAGGNGGNAGIGNDNGNLNVASAGALTFATGLTANMSLYQGSSTGGTERMRIHVSGGISFGTGNDFGSVTSFCTQSGKVASVYRDIEGNGNYIIFQNSSNTAVGSITRSSSSTVYATSSDYRLKENVDYSWDATTRLKQLKPARFNFIADDTNTLVDGFLSHEVSSVVPEAITGTKDAVDGDGNPDYQGIDQSKLVPLLVKTIQELEARITALEA